MSVTCPTCNKQCASEGGLRNHVRLSHGQPVKATTAEPQNLHPVTVDQPAAVAPEPPKPLQVGLAAAAVALPVIGAPLQPLSRYKDAPAVSSPRNRNWRNSVSADTKRWHAAIAASSRKTVNRNHVARAAKLKHRRARKVG